jgi:hypothetical protein
MPYEIRVRLTSVTGSTFPEGVARFKYKHHAQSFLDSPVWAEIAASYPNLHSAAIVDTTFDPPG